METRRWALMDSVTWIAMCMDISGMVRARSQNHSHRSEAKGGHGIPPCAMAGCGRARRNSMFKAKRGVLDVICCCLASAASAAADDQE